MAMKEENCMSMSLLHYLFLLLQYIFTINFEIRGRSTKILYRIQSRHYINYYLLINCSIYQVVSQRSNHFGSMHLLFQIMILNTFFVWIIKILEVIGMNFQYIWFKKLEDLGMWQRMIIKYFLKNLRFYYIGLQWERIVERDFVIYISLN